MKTMHTNLPGVVLFDPSVFEDDRGFFMESWQDIRYEALGLPRNFVQDNISSSAKGVLRGLHFQNPQAQGKLVSVLQGEVFDVAVDIRIGSLTFGKWTGFTLSAANRRQIYIPQGFAHGFCVVSEAAIVMYKCTDYYNPDTESGILWNDPALDIPWPVPQPVLSAKDSRNRRLEDVPREKLPVYGGLVSHG